MNKWEQRFLDVADHIATWSKDPSTKVGAVLFNSKNRIKSVGYNGFPEYIKDDDRLNDRETKYKIIQHAESNLITNCVQEGISTKDCYMAISLFPCTKCAGLIISSGITKIITRWPDDEFLIRWKDELEFSMKLFKEANVKIELLNCYG